MPPRLLTIASHQPNRAEPNETEPNETKSNRKTDQTELDPNRTEQDLDIGTEIEEVDEEWEKRKNKVSPWIAKDKYTIGQVMVMVMVIMVGAVARSEHGVVVRVVSWWWRGPRGRGDEGAFRTAAAGVGGGEEAATAAAATAAVFVWLFVCLFVCLLSGVRVGPRRPSSRGLAVRDGTGIESESNRIESIAGADDDRARCRHAPRRARREQEQTGPERGRG